jgi:hypothetical protein
MSVTQFQDDFQLVADAVLEARHIQEFIWADESLSRKPYNPEAWRVVFQKRVDAIAVIEPSSKSALVELRKRLLQQAALSIKALVVLRGYTLKTSDDSSNDIS